MKITEPKSGHNGWKKFFRKHWRIVVLFAVGVVLASVGAILVFLLRVEDAQSTGMVPTTLALLTMDHIVTFTLHLIFWELVLIGIPAAIGAVVGWQWWKKLPDEEKEEYHFFSRSRTTGGSGGVSILFFIAFCIKVFIDGKWNVAIASWNLDYVVDSMVSILIWVAIIFGIPIVIGVLWWLNYEMKKKPSTESNQVASEKIKL